MALKAQFKGTTKNGGVVYKVHGTPEEIQEYKSTIPAEWLDKHIADDGTMLLFASFAMPGKRDAYHPLYKVVTGDNAGRYTLDTADLRFAEAQLKGVKNAILQDKLATAIVQDLRGTVSDTVLTQIPQVTVAPTLSEPDINKVD
jgi:hypothetical protein